MLTEARKAKAAYEKAQEAGEKVKAFWEYWDILNLATLIPMWMPGHKKRSMKSYNGITDSAKDRINRWIVYADALSFFFAVAISFLQAFMMYEGWV